MSFWVQTVALFWAFFAVRAVWFAIGRFNIGYQVLNPAVENLAEVVQLGRGNALPLADAVNGAAAAVVAGTHAANLILDKKYGKNRAANIIGPKGDHAIYRTGKNLSGTKISSSGVMTGHKWFTNYSLSFKNKLNKKTGQIENTQDFNRGINWAKAFGLAAGLGFIGSTVAKVLTKNKQKENDYVVKQQMNEVSNQKELDYYKKTGKLPKYTGKKRR